MYSKTMLAAILATLSATTLFGQDRLDAYAKLKPTIASFMSIESTNAYEDGWEFDDTFAYGFEIGTVVHLGKGFGFEIGVLALPDMAFEGAKVVDGSDIKELGASTDLYLETYALMFDVTWNFTQPFMDKSPFQAYVGLGLGTSYVSVDYMENRVGNYVEKINGDSGWNPAYRFTVGMEYRVATELILSLSYSYTYLGEAELANSWSANDGQGGDDFDRSLDLDLEANVIQIGLKFVF